MANPEHVELVRRGRKEIAEWRDENRETGLDLRGAELGGLDLVSAPLFGAELVGANLSETDLKRSNLRGADLSEANLIRANFSGADLSRTKLVGARLNAATLYQTDLSGADLSQASLTQTDIIRANLRGTNFAGATLGQTVFAFQDLRGAKGLETTQHFGASSIGIETIYASHGEIPEIFLRGVGIPDIFIKFAKSLVGNPFAFYSCFISYSTRDQDFADRLYADLQARGVRCWFAPHDRQGGRKLHEQIDEAIRVHEKLLLILSPQSISSEWVKREIFEAKKREDREHIRVLFPIRLVSFESLRDWQCFDPDTGRDHAREIREYFIPDFSSWKDHDSYQKEFDLLLRDLKTEHRITRDMDPKG
jgi:hypothetical protein